MRKVLSKCLSVAITCILFASCGTGAGESVNGGIPTTEQLSAAADELGDDMKSLKFSVDGVVCQFPVDTKDMLDAGWYFDSDVKSDLKSIPSNTLVAPAVAMRKNKTDGYGATSCSVQPVNNGVSEADLEDTLLYNVAFSKDKGTTVILPGGITWNSTFDEVKEAYKPEQAVDQNGIKYIIINGEDYHYSVQLNFNSTDNTLERIEFNGRL